MAFEPRHLDLQFHAALTDRDGLMLQQPEGVDFFLVRASARHPVERVLKPVPLAGRFFLANTQLQSAMNQLLA